ncbi:hypothetical protein RchiOBHm_Chr6g0277071 [Rosa chinensis]|uniref:Secreted protein n=1 Tax=Rosa chinensis TaxID=74649 RepID=A0A2P6PSE5_ROSCH|nr:hypothetical protein RchiOBHm_Chr6g0277071 [Rosa chinensis]
MYSRNAVLWFLLHRNHALAAAEAITPNLHNQFWVSTPIHKIQRTSELKSGNELTNGKRSLRKSRGAKMRNNEPQK